MKGLGWSDEEKLLVVAQDGTVHIYSDLSDDFTPFTLGHASDTQSIRFASLTQCREHKSMVLWSVVSGRLDSLLYWVIRAWSR